MECRNQADLVISREDAKTRTARKISNKIPTPHGTWSVGIRPTLLSHAKARRREEQEKFRTKSPPLTGRGVFVEVSANRGNRKEIPRRGGSTISMQGSLFATPVYAKPLRLLNRLTVEMWDDYRIFKAAGMFRAQFNQAPPSSPFHDSTRLCSMPS